MFKPFLSTPEHRTVTVVLRCNLHTYLFLKCWKVFKRTILHNCSTETGSRKRRKARKHLKWVFIMAAAGMQYKFKMCIINRYIYTDQNYKRNTCFCPHFSWAELKDLRLFICTQKAYARTGMFSASRNCVQILATWGRALSCCNMRWWSWMNGTTMGLRILSRYLCAFKMPSIKCTCVCCP